MNSGLNSQKLFYAISSFFLMVLIIFTLKVNYASSASDAGDSLRPGVLPANMSAEVMDMPVKSDGGDKSTGGLKVVRSKKEPFAAADTAAEPEAAEYESVSDGEPAADDPALKPRQESEDKAAPQPDSISSIISVEKIGKMPGDYSIVIDKSRYTLKLYKGGAPVKTYKIAIGRNPDGADKKKKGDLRTPEGNFYIVSIHKSDKWLHEGKYAYGPWFLRLKTPWQGIGIHGTDEPESLGTKASEGCIRMHSEHITELKKLVEAQVTKSKKKVTVDIYANCDEIK